MVLSSQCMYFIIIHVFVSKFNLIWAFLLTLAIFVPTIFSRAEEKLQEQQTHLLSAPREEEILR